MNETAFFTALLQEYGALEAITLHQLSESSFDEGNLVYRIQRADGAAWVARAYQRDRPLPDWFRYFYPWATSDTESGYGRELQYFSASNNRITQRLGCFGVVLARCSARLQNGVYRSSNAHRLGHWRLGTRYS